MTTAHMNAPADVAGLVPDVGGASNEPAAQPPGSAIQSSPPAVVDGSTFAVVEWEPGPDHPLAGTRLAWTGLLNDEEIQQIHARTTYGALPWHRRVVTRAPVGWPR